jgi:hypothetical protein
MSNERCTAALSSPARSVLPRMGHAAFPEASDPKDHVFW